MHIYMVYIYRGRNEKDGRVVERRGRNERRGWRKEKNTPFSSPSYIYILWLPTFSVPIFRFTTCLWMSPILFYTHFYQTQNFDKDWPEIGIYPSCGICSAICISVMYYDFQCMKIVHVLLWNTTLTLLTRHYN